MKKNKVTKLEQAIKDLDNLGLAITKFCRQADIVEQYINKIVKQDKQWLGKASLYLYALLNNINLVILHKPGKESNTLAVDKRYSIISNQDKQSKYIIYQGGMHFDKLELINSQQEQELIESLSKICANKNESITTKSNAANIAPKNNLSKTKSLDVSEYSKQEPEQECSEEDASWFALETEYEEIVKKHLAKFTLIHKRNKNQLVIECKDNGDSSVDSILNKMTNMLKQLLNKGGDDFRIAKSKKMLQIKPTKGSNGSLAHATENLAEELLEQDKANELLLSLGFKQQLDDKGKTDIDDESDNKSDKKFECCIF